MSNSDLSWVWPRLKSGEIRIAEHATSPEYAYLSVVESAEPILAPWSEDAAILERILCGEAQKVVAMDLACAISTISSRCTRSLRGMGLTGSLSEVPVSLVMLVQFHQRKLGRLSGEIQPCSAPGRRGYRIQLERPDHGLRLLSPAELQIVGFMVEGLNAKQIARRRASAQRTVANQVARIYLKLGVSRRVALIERLLAMKLADSGLAAGSVVSY